jgi:L,D-transpeptidase ErfK/SrfK
MFIANKHNKSHDPWLLKYSDKIRIPSQFILPNAKHKDIIINLAEMRLYYFHTKSKKVSTYPVGVGKPNFTTPVMASYITQKKQDPAWYPTKAIRASYAARGIHLPYRVAPGKHNPLGQFAMRLHRPTYLIHGTNHPGAIGLRSSHGCVRMLNDDIEELFYFANLRTKVNIIYQPLKIGTKYNKIYIESHPRFKDEEASLNKGDHIEQAEPIDTMFVIELLKKHYNGQNYEISLQNVEQALYLNHGLPVEVGRILD